MDTIDKPGSEWLDKSGSEAPDPVEIEVPGSGNPRHNRSLRRKIAKRAAAKAAAKAGSKAGSKAGPKAAAKAAPKLVVLDFDDARVQGRWKTILERQRGDDLASNLLTISRPRTKIDPIADEALKTLREEFMGKPKAAEKLEEQVRASITRRGIATQVKKVTDRLNRRRMTEGRRLVLATTYVYLLSQLVEGEDKPIKKLMEDDLGVAERIMLDLEEKDGPFDVFANLIVASVMNRNRVTDSETIKDIVSQKVRAAI